MKRFGYALAGLIFLVSSCATTTITFKTAEKGTVGIVDPSSPGTVIDTLGETPLTVPLEKVRGKLLRIAEPGKVSQYWFIPPVSGAQVDAQIRLSDDIAALGDAPAGDQTDPRRRLNVLFRLLFQSSQALARDDYETSKRLAEQAATIDGDLAAPQILIGLAAMQSGAADEARAAFGKARALDPEDKDIDDLLGALK